MNLKKTGGRITVLFLLAIMMIGIVPTMADNTSTNWENIAFETVPQNDGVLTTVDNEFSIELWHYSGGYWGCNDIKIYDSQAFDDPEKLADAVNTLVDFEMPIPEIVQSEMEKGTKVIIQCEAGRNLDYKNLFSIGKLNPQFRFENGKVHFKAFPKYNFQGGFTYNDFVTGLNKTIPFVKPEYGLNRYSIWSKSGNLLGIADNYINPANLSELGSVGTIHPSQITGSNGYLQSVQYVRIYDPSGNPLDYNSDAVSIGHGTFQNAGAVAVHFWYPMKITFYKVAAVENDVAVTQIEKTSYPASQGVTAEVTVKNNGLKEVDTTLDFDIPGILDEDRAVHLNAGESKVIPFSFGTPESGSIIMTAEVNKARTFEEVDYSNNKLSVTAVIEAPPIYPETGSCSDTIRWTETDSHTITYPCSKHGSHSYTCSHTFVYETKLTTTYNIAPRTLKSGYGFVVTANTSINTRMVSNSGCGSWGGGRSPSKKPVPPTKAEVRLNYKVVNKLGTQPYTVQMFQTHLGSTTSAFEPKANPISEIHAKKIYTAVGLKGTSQSPAKHYFNIYVSGGGVNGVEFCKVIHDFITINGNLYEDDFTGAH